MSLIPTNNNENYTNNTAPNSLTPFTPFPQHFWDDFLSSPSPFPFPFPSFPFPFTSRTVPYSEMSVETSGTIRARLECKEIDEAHVIVAELLGVEKDDVEVVGEDGGFVTVSDRGGNGRFYWRLRLDRGSNPGLLSWSMENGVLTVLVPKVGLGLGFYDDYNNNMGWGHVGSGQERNVRQIEIEGSDE